MRFLKNIPTSLCNWMTAESMCSTLYSIYLKLISLHALWTISLITRSILGQCKRILYLFNLDFNDVQFYNSAKEGFKIGDLFMSFKSVFQDVRNAVDYVHMKGDLKKTTVDNLSKYVIKDERLPMLMQRILESGAKTFLLTNSEWWYTNEVNY